MEQKPPSPGPEHLATSNAGAQKTVKRTLFARWRAPLQALFAVFVLSWVFQLIPWRDVALFRDDGGEVQVSGELVGDWKQDRVGFLPAQDSNPLPGPFAALQRTGDGSFELSRDANASGQPSAPGHGFDWRPGMLRVFREMDPRGLAVALSLFVLGQLIVVTRWWRLLHGAGLRVSWYESLRLTCLGLFFNLAVPGLTGGDLVKALLAARAHPSRKPEALVSIAFDRLLGLLCMAVLAAVAVLLSGDVFAEIRLPVVGAAVLGVVGAVAIMSGGLRRAIGLERILSRLPLAGVLQKLDAALVTYSRQPAQLALCVLLSFLNHLTVIGGILVLGRAFGDDILAWSSYFAIAPVATIVSALPIAPGGWGLGEAAYSSLFSMLGASAAIGLATSVSFRLLQMVISLVAGLFLFAPGSARLEDMKNLGGATERGGISP